MNVGILLGGSDAKAGGAFTFTEEIIRSVFEYTDIRGRQFMLLAEEEGAYCDVDLPSHVSVVDLNSAEPGENAQQSYRSLNSSKNHSPSRLRRIANSVADIAFRRKRYLSYQERLVRAIHDNGISLVWSLGCHTPIMPVPYITTVWDLQHRLQPYFPEVSSSGWTWEQREDHYSSSLRRAAAIITGTDVGRAEIKFFYQIPSQRVHVIPFPTPCFATDGNSRPARPIVLNGKSIKDYVFYPSQFWPHKNHIAILNALKTLRDEHAIELSAVFVGADMGNLAYVQGMVEKLDLCDQVHFPGFVERNLLIDLYRNAVALTFASYFGPDNLPPLEAFALGCPVIAANVAGASEQLGDAAVLVDPADHFGLAREIKELATNQGLRTALIAKGHARAQTTSGRDYVEKVSHIIDMLAAVRSCWDLKGFIHR